jgi:hypothetical protein
MSVDVGFVVDKVTLGQVFPRVLRFSPVSLIPPVLHYTEKRKKVIIFITGLHNKPQGCGASVASAAGPFTTHTHTHQGTEGRCTVRSSMVSAHQISFVIHVMKSGTMT